MVEDLILVFLQVWVFLVGTHRVRCKGSHSVFKGLQADTCKQTVYNRLVFNY